MKKGWQTKRLGDVCEIIKGRKPALKATSSNGDLPYLVAKVMRGSAEAEYASVKDRNSVTVEDSETIIICDGSNSGEVFTGFRGILSSTMGKISKKAEIDDSYLRAFLASTFEVFNGAKTGAAIPHLDKEAMYQLEFPFPSFPEQQRIVGILDEAFAGIATAKANAEKCLRNARALFESYLQPVFTQRGKGGARRLDEVCTFSSGGTPSKSNSSYWSGKIPWVSGRDMKSTQLSDSLLHISRSAVDGSSTRVAPAGTLLILVRGMGLAHGAQIAELMVPCAFNQDIKGIHPEPDLIPRFLLFALRDRINSSNNVLSNAAHGTLKIDSAGLKNVMIPVPPLEHQRKVVNTIDSLREETQRLGVIYQQKLAALEELKKSMLKKAFEGSL
ncbi:MAG: restriction endonuclease subunit S [Candidatus Omnitrophota bacterium]|jgi:type I restriction enzyme S subunit